ncbi:hypothetical protein LCGC14_1175990 [marine sediment metagenome]|uniref:Uncharacterized protein n=1 Tax=marine sediment metagenome TaxID=412755 RepID=A0A0F9P6J4_9ZZZZ
MTGRNVLKNSIFESEFVECKYPDFMKYGMRLYVYYIQLG